MKINSAMNKLSVCTLLLGTGLAPGLACAAAAGGFAGGFADGFNQGMTSGANVAAINVAIMQQRMEMRAKYGTREIDRLDVMFKNADARLYETFKELSGEANKPK